VILVANEGVDRPVVERLRQEDHDVVYEAELSPSITDEEVLELANTRSAVLLTESVTQLNDMRMRGAWLTHHIAGFLTFATNGLVLGLAVRLSEVRSGDA
jgi:hypothetical protein